MPNDTQLAYRTPHDPDTAAGPREDLGRVDVPVIGAVTGQIRLDHPFLVSLDRHAVTLEPAGGLVLRAGTLPTIEVRAVHVDLDDGLVRTEADGLGSFFDRVLTVALCSALRQTLGWQPGVSVTKAVAGRLPRGKRRRWARASVPADTRLSLAVAGDAITVTLTRPAILRVLGLPMHVSSLRYDFATARITAEASGVGPIRRGLLRLIAWGATRWLRPRLPPALREPGYDLFTDDQRRAHIQALIAALRAKPDEPAEPMGAGAGRPGHTLARAGKGDRAGFLGLLCTGKAATVAALLSLRISADDVPDQTRVLVRLPLGPLSRLALCTDRGGEVVITKHPGGLRLAAPLGVYLFADQFPELAELRLTRVDVDLSRKREVGLDIQTEPPLGPFAHALLAHLVDTWLRPRVPSERLTAAGVWDDGPDHLLWRHDLGADRDFTLRTARDAEVRLRHTDDELVLEAPAGLAALLHGLPVPAANLHRISYRWDDGTITVDGAPELGAFGQTVGAALMRVRVAPHLPASAGVHAEDRPQLDAQQLEKFAVVLAAASIPLIGKLELRMDPQDTLHAALGPALALARSDRGLLLVAHDLRLAVHLRSARYDLGARALLLDASPAPGPYLTSLAALCLDAFLVPLLRKAVPLAPDAPADERWTLLTALGVRVSLPPGATLTARRTPDSLELGASAPLEVDGQGGPLADFTIDRLRWHAADDRLEVDSTPGAGPLLSDLVRRVVDLLVPDFIARAVTERLGLPAPRPRERTAAPTTPPLFATEVTTLGPLALYVDVHAGLTWTMRHDRGELRFGAGAIVRADRFAAQVEIHSVAVTFLPFTISVVSDPSTGPLEDHLLAQLARTFLAPALRTLWPADRAPHAGRDVLLALGPDAAWGPIELYVPPGGQVDVHLDHDGLALRSDAGIFLNLDWLPDAGVRALSVRFADGAVDLEVGEVPERFYHEVYPVSPTATAIAARMLAVHVTPHTPEWAQRLGARILPPPKPLPEEPGRKLVWDSQLPGGLAHLEVRMDPMDLLELRANRVEISFTSELGLHLDLVNLGLRVPLFHARYHMLSGELQLGDLGQLENAVAEGLLRRALAAIDGDDRPVDDVTLIDVLDRFPVKDGHRILFSDKIVELRVDQHAEFIVRVGTEGLLLTVDPPVEIDGPAVLNFVFHGLRYDFADGAFHLDWQHDGVISRLFAGVTRDEGEALLNSLRPALPAAMRKPGYSLAADPDPGATLGQLVRTLRRRPTAPPEAT